MLSQRHATFDGYNISVNFLSDDSVAALLTRTMSTNTSFIEKEWLSLGRKWADVPPWIKHQGMHTFTIPAYIEQQILPAPKISIHQFINFPLPTATVIVHAVNPLDYFSRYGTEPVEGTMLVKICQLPMPTWTVVKELV